MDGQKQRRALTAAEQALDALGSGEADKARRAATRAVELDQVGAFDALAGLVDTAANEILTAGTVSATAWKALADSLGPGPLAALAEHHSRLR